MLDNKVAYLLNRFADLENEVHLVLCALQIRYRLEAYRTSNL